MTVFWGPQTLLKRIAAATGAPHTAIVRADSQTALSPKNRTISPIFRSTIPLMLAALLPLTQAFGIPPETPTAQATPQLSLAVYSASTETELSSMAQEISRTIDEARAQDPNVEIQVVIQSPESREATVAAIQARTAAEPPTAATTQPTGATEQATAQTTTTTAPASHITRERIFAAVTRGMLSSGATVLTLTLLPDVEWYQSLLTATSLGIFSFSLKLKREAYDKFLDWSGGKVARFLDRLTLRGLNLQGTRFAPPIASVNQYNGKLFMWWVFEVAFLGTSEIMQQLGHISHHGFFEAVTSILFSSTLSTYFQAPTELYLFKDSNFEYEAAPLERRRQVQTKYDLMLLGLSASSIVLGVAMQQEIAYSHAITVSLGTAGILLNLRRVLKERMPQLRSRIASQCNRLLGRP